MLPSLGSIVYRNGIKLNGLPLTGTTYDDASYSGNSLVTYELRSVDSVGQEGPGRIARVYRLSTDLTINDRPVPLFRCCTISMPTA